MNTASQSHATPRPPADPLPKSDRVATIGDKGRRNWVYPAWVRGRFMTWRTAIHWGLMVLLLIGPWIDVGGHPGIRIDIPGRRIYLWGLTLFATDGAYLLFLVGAVVFSVFFFTALFGRAWCGWACPQTVFLESVIRPLERLLEGSATQRRRLDRAPWNLAKLVRKGSKYGAILVVCGTIGTTFVAYFLGRQGVIEAQQDPWSHPIGTVTFLFITAALFFDFAWFREQTCIVVCPYGRFQSVLLDADSLTVGYDPRRGEPRGKKNTPGAGDCVDCRRCVQVCPTGIDIRQGAQMECIQCMACIDACDDIMDRLHRPRGLIRFSSENALSGKDTRIPRPRVLAYAAGLLAVVLALGFTVSQREPVEVALARQGDSPYRTLPDGRVQNAMRLRIANKGNDPRAFRVQLLQPEDADLVTPVSPLTVPAGTVGHMPLFVLMHPGLATEPPAVVLQVQDDHGFTQQVHGRFLTSGTTGGRP